MFKIGDFSKLSRISIRMLRHYDEIGLLEPDHVDETTNYRYYRADQLPVANRISALKDMGFPLATIAEIMPLYHDSDKLKNHLQTRRAQVTEEAEHIGVQLSLLENTLERFGKEDSPMIYEVTLKEMPKRKVAYARDIIPTYDDERVLWERMYPEIAAQNVAFASPAYPAGVFYDEGYKESDVDVEVQIAITGDYTETENMSIRTIEPMQVASSTYKGSYDALPQVNECIAAWISDNGYEIVGPMFCIYHVSPAKESNPDNYVTEVCYPVNKK